MKSEQGAFTDPAAVAAYAQETPRKVPGLADLHRMTAILLDEAAGEAARILVLGAGGGLELAALAEARPCWRFIGVDPSPPMLEAARRVTAPHAQRITLVEGFVDQAPLGPFDGAACLLTLHFLDRETRRRTLQEIHRRLKPGAALVTAHHAVIGDRPEQWLAYSAAFSNRSGTQSAHAMDSAGRMAERLSLLSPAEEEALLREAGFREPALFYAAFSFRGWVAKAGQQSP